MITMNDDDDDNSNVYDDNDYDDDDDIQGHSGGDLASSLRYLKILSLRSTFPPLR